MIALDAGEAADFLAGAFRGDANASGETAPAAGVATGEGTERPSHEKEKEIMATAEERSKILQMVASGTLNAAEAADLLAAEATAVGSTDVEAPAAKAPDVAAAMPEAEKGRSKAVDEAAGQPRWLKIRVGDLKSGRGKVSVNVPLSLMKFGLQVGRGFAPGLEGVDWGALSEALAGSEKGLLVDVQDEEDGEHVRIYVE